MYCNGFDRSIGITRFFMTHMGVWPYSKTSYYTKFNFLLHIFIMIFFVNIPQTSLLLRSESLNNILKILVSVDMPVGLACLKLTVAWYNKRDFRNLMTAMEKDWKTTEKFHQKEMRKSAQLANNIIIFCYVMTIGSGIIYTICKMSGRETYEKISLTNSTTYRPMLFASIFFFGELQYVSPVYEIIWFFQYFAATIGVFAFSTLDGFFVICVLHLCTQLTILQFDVQNLVSKSKNDTFTKLVQTVVKKHLNLQWFAHCIEKNFNKTFLIVIICQSIILCLQSYHLVINLTDNFKKNAGDILYFAAFSIDNAAMIFILCYVAEKLRIESANVFSAVYETKWYKLKPEESKMIINIMQASKSPLKLTVGKFADLSLEYFTTVLKTSIGYLSVLLALKNKFL